MANRASIGSWLFRLMAWDGLLPAAVWAVPWVIEWLIPHRRGAIEVTAVVLPIVAFFIRYQVGRRYIASNRCGALMRGLQVGVFCVGILLLVLIDAVIVLSHVMPKGAAFATAADCIVWAVLYSIYLTSMAIAMYPGPCEPPDESDPWSDPNCGRWESGPSW